MSLSITRGNLVGTSLGSAIIMAILVGTHARQAAAFDDQGAKHSQTSTTAAAATRTVAGRVVDAEGKSVGSARVWWIVQRGPGFTAAARADSDGRFRLSTPTVWLPREETRKTDVVWVMGPNNDIAVALARAGLVKKGTSGLWVLRLNAAKDVTISVVDAGRQPVAGATVEPAHFRGGHGIELVPDPIGIAMRTTTDAAGHARMHIGFRDFFSIRVTSDQFGIQTVRLNPRDLGPTRTIALNEVGRIEGRVIAHDPKDARGVRLRFQTVSGTHVTGIAGATSDESGNFLVPKLAWGTLNMMGGPTDDPSPVRPRLPESLSLRAGETVHLEVPVERLVRVRGRVETEGTHAPVAGANVTVAYGNGMQGSPAVTDADGRFEVRVLPGSVNSPAVVSLPETFEADYEQAGEPWNDKVDVRPGDKPFELPPVVLVHTITIRGKVIDREGRPVAKAQLCADVGTRRHGFCETDVSGEFSMCVPRTVKIKGYEVWLPPDNRGATVNVVQKKPLVLKAVASRAQ